MIKKTIYPKTKRLPIAPVIQITEKLDGSNLAFFVLNGELYIAQRNNIFIADELTSSKTYKGLCGFVQEHKESLLKDIADGRVVFGEWLGMGQIKYDFKNKFFMFGKGLIDSDFNVTNEVWDLSKFHYAFNDDKVPDYIDVVPLIGLTDSFRVLEVNVVDQIYDVYLEKVGRNVEGFVILYDGKIMKYVRMKGGKLQPHRDTYKEDLN